MKPPNNKKNSAHACSSLTSCFIALASQKLNGTEKQALLLLAQSEEKNNATKTAKSIATQLQCAESTAWSTLRSLRSLGLITYDEQNSTLTLSRSARMFIKEVL